MVDDVAWKEFGSLSPGVKGRQASREEGSHENMVRATLRLHDRLTRGRPWLGSIVTTFQGALAEAGHAVGVDGKLGAGTLAALQTFRAANRLPPGDVADKAVWESLEAQLDAVHRARYPDVDALLPRFRGDLGVVHALEGHAGRAYWPKGKSGVTLDPGVDLGHAHAALIETLYKGLASEVEYAAMEAVFGIRGEPAKAALKADPDLQSIRVSTAQSDALMPRAAASYWQNVVGRFGELSAASTPPSVQTVLLSLAYNRGPENAALGVLANPLAAESWSEMANLIGQMQQNHETLGIRHRRRTEASLIRTELKFLES